MSPGKLTPCAGAQVWLVHLAQTLCQHSHQNFPEYKFCRSGFSTIFSTTRCRSRAGPTYGGRMVLKKSPSRWMSRTCDVGSQLRPGVWIDRRFPLIGRRVRQPQAAASPILSCAIRSRTNDGQEAMPNSRSSPRARNCTAAESVSASMARSSTAHRRQSAADCTSWLR